MWAEIWLQGEPLAAFPKRGLQLLGFSIFVVAALKSSRPTTTVPGAMALTLVLVVSWQHDLVSLDTPHQ